MECPKCGSEVWDNRTGKKNPRQPDYKCKDNECGWVKWLTPKPNGGAPTPKKTAPTQSEDIKIIKEQIDELFALVTQIHSRICGAIEKDEALPF